MAQAYTQTPWKPKGDPGALLVTSTRLNNMESGIFLASAPIVTTLPSSPVDGQECNYVADAANGIVWHLVYRSASAKWHFVGGPGLYSVVDTNATVSAAGWVDASGPSLVFPLAGDYEVSIGGRSINDIGGGGSDIIQSYTIAGSTPIGADGNDLYTPSAQAAVQQANTRVKTGITAGATIAERINKNGGNPGINGRWLRIVPRRVG